MTARINCNKVDFSKFFYGCETKALETAPQKPEGLALPSFSPFDRFLKLLHQMGLVDEEGLIHKEKTPDTLPPLSYAAACELLRFFNYPHQMATKIQESGFTLLLPLFLQSVLLQLNTPYSPYLVGGAVFAFINEEYIKIALNQLDPNLFASLPKECLNEFNKKPNDYDIRIYLNGNLTQLQFSELKKRIVNALVSRFYENSTYDQAQWMKLYQFVLQNCFKKLKIEFSDQNQFLISTFSNGQTEIDLLWIQSLERHYLFVHDSLSLFIPQIYNGQGVPLLIPVGEIANGYQAILDKMTKIIHANNISQINYKGWFVLMYQQATFYRSYVQNLEQTLLQTALKHPIKGDDRAAWFYELLKQCLVEHLDKRGDPVANFCLTLSACRSAHLNGHQDLALALFEKSKNDFPKEGLPSLIDNRLDLHLKLLQIFGMMTHDGENVCYTLNEFKPSLQFILKGIDKSFTFLVPLEIEKALEVILEGNNAETIDRYLAHFTHLSTTRLSIEAPKLKELIHAGLNHQIPSVQRLFLRLLIWHSLQQEDYSHVDKVVRGAQKDQITERYFQGYLKNPSFSFGTLSFAGALLSQNHPALSHLILNNWSGQKEEALQLLKEVQNPVLKIKLLKLIPLSEEEMNAHVSALAPQLLKDSPNAPSLLLEFTSFILASPHRCEVSIVIDQYLKTFGFHEDIHRLLLKTSDPKTYLKTADALLEKHPHEAKKIGQAGIFTPKEEADFLFRLIHRFAELKENSEAAALIPLLPRSLLDKNQQKQITQFIDNQKDNPTLQLLEWDRVMQTKQYPQLPKYFNSLFRSGLGEEIAKRVRQVLSLPKQNDLCQNLLLHPDIDQILSPEELLKAITSHLKNTSLIEKGLQIFPTKHNEIDKAFIYQIIKMKHPPLSSLKVTSLIFKLGDRDLIEEWLNLVDLPHELLKEYLQLHSPNASQRLRKKTTRETLETLKEEYKAYIPLVSEEERSQWVALIIESKVPQLFPLISWMKEFPLALNIDPSIFSQEELPAVQALIKATPFDLKDLNTLLSLYQQFDLVTPSSLFDFLVLSLDHPSKETKLNIVGLFLNFKDQSVSDETWVLFIKLLKQMKSEILIDLIEERISFPRSTRVCKEIAEAAIPLIKEPHHITSLLLFRDKYHLPTDLETLRLCALSRHFPLLVEAISRLIVSLREKPQQIKEHLLILETILKNTPREKQNSVIMTQVDTFMKSVPMELMNEELFLIVVRSLTAYPTDDMLKEGCDLIYHLLMNNLTKGGKIIAPCLELSLLSSDTELAKKIHQCLTHPQLEQILPQSKIDALSIDLAENLLKNALESKEQSKITEALLFFYRFLPKMPHPSKSLNLLIDCLLLLQREYYQEVNLNLYLFLLMQKMSHHETGMTTQAYHYYLNMGLNVYHIKPASLKSHSRDLLFETLYFFINKTINSPAEWIDTDHKMYLFIRRHLGYLVEFYPENSALLAPLIHKFMTFQLPSGFDLNSASQFASSQLLFKACNDAKLFVNYISELYELTCLNLANLTQTGGAMQLKLKALKTVIYKLAHHPSQAGPFRACKIIQIHKDTFCTLEGKTISFLLNAVEEAVLRAPAFRLANEKITQEYMGIVISLSEYNPSLATTHFIQFFNKLCLTIEQGEQLNMISEAILLMNQALSCSIIDHNPIILLLTPFIDHLIDTNLYYNLGEILELLLITNGYDREGVDELTEKILLSLKIDPLKDILHQFSETQEISLADLGKVIDYLKML